MATALITGATSGIGLEITKILAAKYDLFLVSRDKTKLAALKKSLEKQYDINIQILSIDLSKENAAQKVFARVKHADVLVNNAGFGVAGESVDADASKINAMLHLNILTLTQLSALFGQQMKAQRKGYILNIASIAAFQPVPYLASYSASKSYVLNYTEALAKELEEYNVHVTCLCPGVTATHFYTAMGSAVKGGSARDVAVAGVNALFKNKMTVVPGFKNKLRIQFERLLPRWLIARLSKRVMR
ncbi:MAG TPA: SDR family oxidoreductase [Candidatus Nanoarchaeia archaeon]|nr:SDR family oxidoreductase [Candidatus Nanoarchaeia archaeon]